MSNDAVRTNLDTPPHDVQAEQAVLGAILTNPRAVHQIVDKLVPEAFYDSRHRPIYSVWCRGT